ncbi:O-antigen ligase family protein [Candidatus Saccharibacteria bacterium]|nr:O-antigen ligase family protein [Candidatus Saccharibacteria bacterium]
MSKKPLKPFKSFTPSKAIPQSSKLTIVLLTLLPLALFFSYYPVISLGSDATMNFEFSIALIALLAFDIASLIDLLRNYRFSKNYPGLTDRQIFILSWFPFFATASIFWSANPLRATLTAGILWALYFAFLSLARFIHITPSQATKIRNIFFIGSLLICAWCWLQCIFNTLNLSDFLLCAGCTTDNFGFPHPNGFAIEPQFMGNLLLAPTLLALYLCISTRKPLKSLGKRLKTKTAFTPTSELKTSHRASYAYPALFITFATTLFLTFSRGAIYSFLIALVILIVAEIYQRRSATPLRAIIATIIAFLIALTAQGAFSAISPTNDTFSTGVTKSIHQLSLGTIDLRATSVDANFKDDNFSVSITTDNTYNPDEQTSKFSGYVAESTDARLKLNDLALATWSSKPAIALFGVGLGGAGVAINQQFPDQVSSKEIIQNQYLSTLLELGLVGITLAIFGALVVARLYWRHPARNLIFTLGLAYAVSLCFFSGLPNALHIYLMLPFIALITNKE